MNKKDKRMTVVSTRDFRANQGYYFDMANAGEHVVVKSRAKGSFRIVPVTADDAIVQKRDLTEELIGALRQVKAHMEGKIELKTAESLLDEL